MIDIESIKTSIAVFNNTPTPELFSQIVRDNISRPTAMLTDFINRFHEYPDNKFLISEATVYANKILELRMNVPVIGASGAVFGVLLAFGMMFPNTQLMLLFPPIPIKAKWFVLGYGVLELWLGVANRSGDNVAHFAHLGGMIFGFFLIRYWSKKFKRF